MKTSFQQKLILSFLIIFTVFTAGIVLFEQQRAGKYKTEALQQKLDAYADEVYNYIQLHNRQAPMDSLLALMPANLRLTLMERSGHVIFDNVFHDPLLLENHAGRPEIKGAVQNGIGTFIRTSASNSLPYLYYAKDIGNSTIVRVALPYDIQVQSFLKPDNAFLYFVIALFMLGLGFIYYIGHYFGKSVRNLRNFSQALHSGSSRKRDIPEFPDDEFGQIGKKLLQDFDQISESEKKLVQEREKLLLHIQTSAEGICFFNCDQTVAFYNGLFLQYFNIISSQTLAAGDQILNEARFDPVNQFLNNPGTDEYFETRISGNGREFMLRLNIFEDKSFEIILIDITAKEKTRRLKQEMTGNIAHELRTPVTSIRGFLELVLNNQPGKDKTREFLERAYSQTRTLSELIADMSLLTRIDEKQASFDHSTVDITQVVQKVYADTSSALAEKNISFTADIPEGLKIKGNESLLYSVFHNLTDNARLYAGENTAILIKVIEIRDGMAYFSFADTGKGIQEQHLNRLFERFYRINEGRTRDTGGSGLGLSIVKNVIQYHGGSITVRNGINKGLELLFKLPVSE